MALNYVSLMNFCKTTGLTIDQVRDYEKRGLIRGTLKGSNHFYSLREAYRAKGIVFFMRTQGLSADEAARKVDEEIATANQK